MSLGIGGQQSGVADALADQIGKLSVVMTGVEQGHRVTDAKAQQLLDGAAELIAQLGQEYFVVEVGGEAVTSSADAACGHRVRREAIAPNIALAGEQVSRDFWDDVAALSSGNVALSPNAWGAKPDIVAYAIATVAARYTLSATEPRIVTPLNVATNPRAPGSPTPSVSVGIVSSSKHPELADCDLSSVLMSLLGFEQDAALTDVRELDATTFELCRERAASALVAANVMRNSALKAAQGRRG
jgi:hypothetical protein